MPLFHNKSSTHTCQGKPITPGIWRIHCFLATLFLFCSNLLINPIQTVHAQESNAIVVQTPNTDSLPTVTVDFKLPDCGISGCDSLTTEQLEIYENGKQVDIFELSRQYRGILFTLLVNPSSELDLCDATGISRYDKLSESLREWISNRSFQGEDGWSLVTNEGIEVRYAASSKEWISGLNAYQPNFRALQPNLIGLESAIQMLAERVVSLGMDKMLLFITTPPTPEQIEAVKVLAAQASESHVIVNVWMVSDPHYLTNEQGNVLMDMAAMTGGEFFHYTGVEAIPNPQDYLSSLGSFFTAKYESRLTQSGTYPLRVEVTFDDLQLSGESQPFTIDIQPPNPIFISPQTEVTYQVQSEKRGAAVLLKPENITWQIMIAFPDGYPREIVTSRLYIDGNIVDVNAVPPFDTFTWEIPSQFEAGEHTIQVEVVDTLGLSARTNLTPLRVNYHQPERISGTSIQRIIFILIGFLLGGSLFLFIIWLARRFEPQRSIKQVKDTVFRRDAVSHSTNTLSAPHPKPTLATLMPLDDETEAQAIPLRHRTTTLGSNPDRVQALIIGEEVQAIHALIQIKEKKFWIQDLNSHSYTWVNYRIIGTENVQIYPGDLIHFGSTGFRFTIKEDKHQNVTVSKYELYP